MSLPSTKRACTPDKTCSSGAEWRCWMVAFQLGKRAAIQWTLRRPQVTPKTALPAPPLAPHRLAATLRSSTKAL